MTPNKISEHRDRHHDLAYPDFVRTYWIMAGNAPDLFPDPAAATGEVVGFIDSGSHFAQCPGCLTAFRLDVALPLFLCTTCGNAGNGFQWTHVHWPADIQAIRNVLARRPATNILRAPMRNYHPQDGDTLAALQAENRDMGLDDGTEAPSATLEELMAGLQASGTS